jgi:hypothetical protein
MVRGNEITGINYGGAAKLLAYTWLPQYSADSDTDFLTEHASTWLIYSSLGHLNFYLKEDQRVQLSTAILSTAWQAVITWNETLWGNVTSFNLD